MNKNWKIIFAIICGLYLNLISTEHMKKNKIRILIACRYVYKTFVHLCRPEYFAVAISFDDEIASCGKLSFVSVNWKSWSMIAKQQQKQKSKFSESRWGWMSSNNTVPRIIPKIQSKRRFDLAVYNSPKPLMRKIYTANCHSNAILCVFVAVRHLLVAESGA